ncbi:MAG: PKD domain-containing protein [Pseudomonadota bacterium]
MFGKFSQLFFISWLAFIVGCSSSSTSPTSTDESDDTETQPIENSESSAITPVFTMTFEGDEEDGLVTFDASSSRSTLPIKSYQFDFGDGVQLLSDTPVTTHKYTSDGEFSVKLIVTDQQDFFVSKTETLTVDVAAKTQINISRSSNLFGLAPLSATLDASASSDPDGIKGFRWSIDEQVISELANFTQVFNEGTTLIKLEVINNKDEISEASYAIQAVGLPQDKTVEGEQQYLVRKETDDTNLADVYVNRMLQPLPGEDPNTSRATFADWYEANSFPGEQWTNARYFNGGDLGFGRDMYCIKSDALKRISCFTTNYGNVGSDRTDIKSSIEGSQAGEHPFATVCMEFVADAAEGETIRFFAYEANPTPNLDSNPDVNFNDRLDRMNGPAVSQVILDGEGLKDFPGACIVCHGGGVNQDNPLHVEQQIVTNSGFLPFDAEVFSYLDSDGNPVELIEIIREEGKLKVIDTNAYDDLAVKAQVEQIAVNNSYVVQQHVWDAEAKTPGISMEEIIKQRPIVEYLLNTPPRHGGLAEVGTDPYIPEGYVGYEEAYEFIIKPFCRGCHFSQYQEDEFDLKSFNPTYLTYGCVDDLLMPHAEVTDRNFLIKENLERVQEVLRHYPSTENFECNPQRIIESIPTNLVQANIPTSHVFDDMTGVPFGWTVNDGELPLTSEAIDINEINTLDRHLASPRDAVDNTTAAIQLTENFVDGFVSYDVNVSSELNSDFLRILLDGVEIISYSGVVDLDDQRFPITAGTHTLRIEYVKDAAGADGLDQGFIDNLKLPIAFINTANNRRVLTFEDIRREELNEDKLPIGFTKPELAVNAFVISDVDPLADNKSLSAVMPNGGTAEVEFTGEFGEGDLEFNYRVNSAAVKNLLLFYIDDVAIGRYEQGTEGKVRIRIPAGQHTLYWRYVGNAGADNSTVGAQIDQIIIPTPSAVQPAPEQPPAPEEVVEEEVVVAVKR